MVGILTSAMARCKDWSRLVHSLPCTSQGGKTQLSLTTEISGQGDRRVTGHLTWVQHQGTALPHREETIARGISAHREVDLGFSLLLHLVRTV